MNKINSLTEHMREMSNPGSQLSSYKNGPGKISGKKNPNNLDARLEAQINNRFN